MFRYVSVQRLELFECAFDSLIVEGNIDLNELYF